MSITVTPDQAMTVFNSTRLLLMAMDSARRADHPLSRKHHRKLFLSEARNLRRLGVTARSLRTLVNQVDAMAPEPEEEPEGAPHGILSTADIEALGDKVVHVERLGAQHIEQLIYQDAIRQALGWDIRPGRLSELTQESRGPIYWRLTDGYHADMFSHGADAEDRGWKHIPALAGITVPEEAMKAIYEELCT